MSEGDDVFVHLRNAADWPLLLMGPIVRRVTRDKAHIFIAVKEACIAQLLIREGWATHGQIADADDSNAKTLHMLGLNLYVGLLEINLPDPGPDRLYSYDIQIRLLNGQGDPEGGNFRLNDLGLLGNPHDPANPKLEEHLPLGYDSDFLPSFLTPPGSALSLRLAQVSCRKPHGNPDSGYEPDALPILDEIIARALYEREIEDADTSRRFLDAIGLETAAPEFPPRDLTERPHQLVMTGDQIYADDVAAALLDNLMHASLQLLGWEEALPGIDQEINEFLVQPGWRSRYLEMAGVKEAATKPESDYNQSHLLRFGEWCAMYLMAWSPALWPRTNDESKVRLRPSADRLPISGIIGSLKFYEILATLRARQPVNTPITILVDQAEAIATDSLEQANKAEEKRAELWDKYREPAMQYGSTVPYVRRVLANTPTYTMFDDHEITDDWFLNRDVTERLLGYVPYDEDFASPPPSAFWGRDVGPRILRNGLSAYAIFQHWGNAPEDFDGWESPAAPADPSVGRQLLDLWKPGLGGSGPLLPQLAGPEVDTSIIKASLWWSAGVDVDDVPAEARDYWLAWSWAPHSDTRLADTLLRIDDYPTDENGNYPGTGSPALRETFGRFRWDYAIEFDSHRLIALDTRTWRRFPELSTPSAPPGVDIPGTALLARDASAPILSVYALAWTQSTDTAMQVVADVMTATHTLLTETTLADYETALRGLGTVLQGYLPLALSGTSIEAEAEFAVTQMLDELDGLAPFSTRPAAESDLDYWIRASALLATLGALRPANFVEVYDESLLATLSSLGNYVHGLCMGSERAALIGLMRFVNQTADATAAGATVLNPTLADKALIEVARVAAVASLTTEITALTVDDASDWFFRDGSGYHACELISAPALDWMVSGPIANLAPEKETVLLSPAPIFGVDFVENLQMFGVGVETVGGGAGAETYDFEAWSANPVGFDNLIVAAKGLDTAVVLSGDVHYGYSSVNRVTLPREEVDTTYIQFCSSAGKNSDANTKTLGTWGYLVWTEGQEHTAYQFAPVPLFRRGWDYFDDGTVQPDPTDPIFVADRFVGWLGEKLNRRLADYAVAYHFDDMALMIEEWGDCETPQDVLKWYYRWFLEPSARAIGDVLQNPDSYAAAAWQYITEAPVNSFTAWKDETLWMMIATWKNYVEFAEDPGKKVFGHRLYARDVLTKLVGDIYKSVAVDPAYGFEIKTTSLSDDQGPGRLALYGARTRFSADEPNTMMFANEQESHIVGSANVGLVRFVSDVDKGPGARHDLLFFPDPSHPGVVTQPPGPLFGPKVVQPDIGEVRGYLNTRLDWMSTRHVGYFSRGTGENRLILN